MWKSGDDSPRKLKPSVTPAAGDAQAFGQRDGRLSIRRPSELLAMQFGPKELLLDCGILAKGQGLTLLGPGGVGKSRLVLQLAASLILGKPFLGLQVNCKKVKVMILQTENVNRRLNADLTRMRKGFTNEEWADLDSHLLLHTIEHEGDQNLRLTEAHNAEAIARLIKEHKPDVVVFDPLYAFAHGNLNQDEGMIATTEKLTKLARLGNPEAAVVIVHHVLTGSAGAKRVTGPDRASYGRGSKALHGWARGQLNVGEDPDEKGSIIIACGKNSNGPDFEPFTAKLNAETHLYEVTGIFAPPADLHGGQVKVTSAMLAEIVKDLPMTLKDLASTVMAETGCAKSKAYQVIKAAVGKSICYNAAKELTPLEPKSVSKEAGNP